MTINIVPISGTVPRTGKFGVVASHPGTVTLTASDPRCVLTPSYFDVGGSVACRAVCSSNTGIASASNLLNFNKNFGIAVEVYFENGTAAYSHSLWNFVRLNAATINWSLFWDPLCRLSFVQTNGTPVTNLFSQVFPRRTWIRLVLSVDATTAKLDTNIPSTQTIIGRSIGAVGASTVTRTQYGLSGSLIYRNLEILGSVPTASQVASYLAGTKLAASASLLLDQPGQEESGSVYYDFSPNLIDFTLEDPATADTYGPMIYNPRDVVVTGLTNTEQSISYDMTTIPPGTNVTITASRVKAGFPTGRTPDISVESDTSTFTVAPVSVTGITLNKASALLDIGDTTTLTATVWPKG